MIRSTVIYYVLFAAATVVYILGLFVDVMGVDSNQYASIAMEMMQSGDYLEVHHRGEDYLDKPPLLFWLSALSFKIFGVSNFAFKLPTLIVTFFGIYATYRLGKRLYHERIGVNAALILYASHAWFLFNQDVRTDAMLASFVIIAVWQIVEFLHTERWRNLILGFIAIGMAMLAKGPMGLMLPVLGLSAHWILKREWKNFFRWEWLAGIGITLLVLSPMIYGLYQQWDAHPEKTLYGQNNISGVKFFFWDQSFGRLTGDNPFINNMTNPQGQDPTYFIHTTLWTFLPWSIAGFAALIGSWVRIFRQRFRLDTDQEGITATAVLLPMIALSFSGYKLPHYIYVVFPFLAILVSSYLDRCTRGYNRIHVGVNVMQWVSCIGILLLYGSAVFYMFPDVNVGLKIFLGLLLAAAIFLMFVRWLTVVQWSAVVMITGGLILNTWVNPSIAKYESGHTAARFLRENGWDKEKVAMYKMNSHALEYSLRRIVPYYNHPEHIRDLEDGTWVYTDTEGKARLDSASVAFDEVVRVPHYPTTLLTIEFLDSRTRDDVIMDYYLVRL